MHLSAGLELGDRLRGPQGSGGPAHVNFHHLDAAAGDLNVEPARIEGEALAHDRQLARRRTSGLVGEVNELGRQLRGLGHPQVGPHAQGFTLLLVEYLKL